MSPIDLEVLYFGGLRQLLGGSGREGLTLDGARTVDAAFDRLCERHPSLAAVRTHVRVAVNEEFATPEARLADGDTLALIPPVAGGSPELAAADAVWLSEEPLRVEQLMEAVSGPGQGGLCVFIGTVRDHSNGKRVVQLDYEAYPEMVLASLAAIVERCQEVAEDVRVAVAHRVGTLEIGDAAVIVAASAPHRAQAFEACRMCIEQLKQDVPIWKREISTDGEEWLGLRP